LRELDIFVAGQRIATRMVVGKNDSTGVQFQRAFQNGSGLNQNALGRPRPELLLANQPVCAVQKQRPHDFGRTGTHACPQILDESLIGTGNKLARQVFLQTCQHQSFCCVEQSDDIVFTDQNAAQGRFRLSQYTSYRAKFSQQVPREPVRFTRRNKFYELRQDLSVPMLFSLFWW